MLFSDKLCQYEEKSIYSLLLGHILFMRKQSHLYKNLNSYWYLHLSFAAYILLLFFIIPKHEPWADEAQAWLLARDSSVFELLFKNLRYEGSPGLWHLILMIPSRVLNYEYFGYISAVFGIAAVYIIFYKSPFPVWIRLILPFTYFSFFQYVVVARCYVLFLVLLPLIACFYKKKLDKPLLYGVLLIVLANVNLHGFLMSLVLSAAFFVEAVSNWNRNKRINRKLILIWIFMVINVGFVIMQIIPAPDISFSSQGFAIDLKHLSELTHHVLGHLFTDIPVLSYFVLGISLVWFWKNKILWLYLAMTIPILILFSIYYNIWHQGVLLLIWLFCLWLAYDNKSEKKHLSQTSRIISWLMNAAIFASLIFQVYWNVIVSVNDYKSDFSAGKKIACYIKENHLENKKICATQFWSVSVLPYFDHNIYQSPEYEEGKSFWIWKTANDFSEPPDEIIAKQPDFIIFSRPKMFWYPDSVPGYQEIKIARGTVFWKDSIKEVNDFRFFIKEK